jgi:predicted nucleic acid-binding protein
MAKKKVICDTDVMIDYLDKDKPRHAATKSTLETVIELDNVVLSAITKMELMIGAVNKTDMTRIAKKLGRFNIALINGAITLQAFDLIQSYRLSHGLSLPDSIIAATTMIADLELYTYNLKDFKFIHRLRIYTTTSGDASPQPLAP